MPIIDIISNRQIIKCVIIAASFSVFTQVIAAHSQENHKVAIFDFQRNNEASCSSSDKDCYTVESLVKRALETGLESQEKLQLLFQVHEEVKLKLSHLFPELNVYSVVDSAMERAASIDAITSFTGFLFPHRWLEWQASRYLKQASEESIATLFANQVQIIQHLYYDIQMQVWSLKILDFYIAELNSLIMHLNAQKDAQPERITQADIAILMNIKAKLEYDRAFMDSLASYLPRVATAIGLSPEFDWASLKLEPCAIDTEEKPRRKYFDFYGLAIERSTEIKTLEFLIESAKKSLKAHYLEFLDPHSGQHLGLGFGSHIKIARSKIKNLNIESDRIKMSVSNKIQNSLNYYTESTVSLPKLAEGIKELEHIKAVVDQSINDENVPLDINYIARFFETAEGQAMRYIYAYFVYRTAKADFDRYTWAGKLYQIAREYHTVKVPVFLEEIKREHSFRYRIKQKLKRH